MHATRHAPAYLPRYWPTWLALGLLWSVTRLPYAWQLGLGRLLGRLALRIARHRRRIAEVNIELCFPERTDAERRRLVSEHFESLGIGLLEFALAWWGTPARLAPLASIRGLEHLHSALEAGHGVLLLSAHFTTLEIGGRLLAAHIPFHVLYREHKHPVIEQVMGRARTRLYERAIPRNDMKALLRSLKENRAVWFAPDQDHGAAGSVFVPFFGVAAATLTTTSRIAAISGARVVPFFQRRLPGHRGYELELLPALEAFPGDDVTMDTARLMQLIEARVRQQPEQYLWAHRRFKTRPAGGAPVYDE
jgi:KDO2-lipid IV(A) lauroyltransferase